MHGEKQNLINSLCDLFISFIQLSQELTQQTLHCSEISYVRTKDTADSLWSALHCAFELKMGLQDK